MDEIEIDVSDKKDETGMISRHEVNEVFQSLIKTFQCKQCGQCCRETYPQLSKPEIKFIAKSLKLTVKGFKDQYTTIYEGNTTLKSPCPFLKRNTCTIYSIRPMVCEEYPLRFSVKSWTSILMGINKCPLVTEINAKLNEFKSKFGNVFGLEGDVLIQPPKDGRYYCLAVSTFIITSFLLYLETVDNFNDIFINYPINDNS